MDPFLRGGMTSCTACESKAYRMKEERERGGELKTLAVVDRWVCFPGLFSGASRRAHRADRVGRALTG